VKLFEILETDGGHTKTMTTQAARKQQACQFAFLKNQMLVAFGTSYR
jgi:prolyl oligopeptidase PreP (S9A serine peptidase family)